MLVLFAVQQSKAQVPAIVWQKCLGGSNYDRLHSISQTNDGGYIMIGMTSSTDGDLIQNTIIGSYWVVKITNSGIIEWQKVLEASGIARDIKPTTDGGYIVIGYISSNGGDVTGHHGDYDYWVVKLDGIGDIEWQKTLGGTRADYPTSISITNDGGYIIAGYSNSLFILNATTNYGFSDYWIVKLDSTGNIQWEKSYGGSDGDYAYSIQQTNDGGYIIAGSSYSNYVGFGSINNHHGLYDVLVLKIDSIGTVQWQKFFGGSLGDGAVSILQTNDGGYLFGGYTESNNADVSGNHGHTDIWIVKIDTIGTMQWQKCLGGTVSDQLATIQNTNDSGYIIAGHTTSNNGDVSGNNGASDYWIVKLDSVGNIDWQKCLGGTVAEHIGGGQQTNDGGYIFVGQTESNNGDVSGNHGYSDAWIVKLSSVVLPLQWYSFTATLQNKNGLLQWQTANEINTSHFNIQRSTNGTEFTTIGITNAAGSGDNKYSYTDNNIVELMNSREAVYYRLQNMDKDGSYTYSKTVQITYNFQHPTFNIYPNPARNIVYINGNNINEVRVIDNSGKTVLYKTFNGANNVQLNIATLAKGLYMVQVKDSKGNVGVEKLVVE